MSFRTVRSEHRYRGFSSVRVDTIEGPSGRFDREVVEHADAVAIVALDPEGLVALVRQHRQPLGHDLLEIPAGTLDVEGESPIEAARRELAEEVGLSAEALIPLGRMYNSAGWSDETTMLYLAPVTRPIERPRGFALRDEEAAMTVEWRTLDELVTAALDGTLTDAKSIVGVLRARSALEVNASDGRS